MQAMALMIFIAIYGYLRPYSWNASNILEVVVLVDFLIMLLIRNDPAIVVQYSLFPSSNVSSSAEFTSCHAYQEMEHFFITTLTKILTAFYYTPLLLFFLTILVTISWVIVRKCAPGIYNQWVVRQPANKVPWEDVSNLNLSLRLNISLSQHIHIPLIQNVIIENFYSYVYLCV